MVSQLQIAGDIEMGLCKLLYYQSLGEPLSLFFNQHPRSTSDVRLLGVVRSLGVGIANKPTIGIEGGNKVRGTQRRTTHRKVALAASAIYSICEVLGRIDWEKMVTFVEGEWVS